MHVVCETGGQVKEKKVCLKKYKISGIIAEILIIKINDGHFS